jgi:ureidoglycolate lyase
MKLLRVGNKGAEKPAILHTDGTYRDLSSVVPDITGATIGAESLARIKAADASKLPVLAAASRIGPCVGGVGKFICVGLNYADHAAESGMQVPPEPVLFMKATSAIIGPNDQVVIPKNSTKADWEVELGVIIGKSGRNIVKTDALGHVFGYTVINDLSARDLQSQHMQWFKGKSLDGFCPMGPFVVTADEFGDPQNKRLQLRVNGVTKQDGQTSNMIFPVDVIIEWLSKGLTLEAGDVIATGTPEGVGMGRTPQEFLQNGDIIETEVEGIGVLRNRIVDR